MGERTINEETAPARARVMGLVLAQSKKASISSGGMRQVILKRAARKKPERLEYGSGDMVHELNVIEIPFVTLTRCC